MRLDKYLKVSRLIKRRAVAKEVGDRGQVTINGRVAKPSSAVSVGDRIVVRLARGELAVIVEAVPEMVAAKDAARLYRIVASEPTYGEGDGHTLR